MRPGPQLKASKAIKSIRALQRLAAERRLAEARRALRAVEARCETGRQRLSHDEDAWSRHMASAMLEPGLAASWARSIVRASEALTALQGEAHCSHLEGERTADACRAAVAHAENARMMARSAERRARRLQEEAALAEATDQFNQRRTRP